VICLMPQCGYLSETSRAIEIYRALEARGVRPRVATHGGRYESLLQAAGIPYDVVGPHMDAARSDRFVRSAVGMGDVRQSMYDDDELRTYVEAEAEYLSHHRIKVTVTGFLLTTLLSSRLAGTTVVTDHGSWVPPVYERGLIPAPARPPWPMLRLLPTRFNRWLSNAVVPRSAFYCGGFNRVARKLGVEPVPSMAALVLGDVALVTDVPEVLGVPVQDMHGWAPAGGRMYRPGTRLRYVGPIYARLDAPLPARVAEFLGQPGPSVYVAITSGSADVVRSAVTALAALDVRVLVAATAHDLRDLSGDRVMVEGLLPSHLIMPRVSLAITAGGQGSVQTAMASGTPLIGIPLQAEQDLNVVLLERLGAARRVSPGDLGRRLAGVAAEILDDDGYRSAAQRIQRLYGGVDGPANAADVILGIAAERNGAALQSGV
jgi:UDP:flavonoid glycosyltransferase YjiC (YdhE family)